MVNSLLSKWTCSIPWGSVLGPVLFNMCAVALSAPSVSCQQHQAVWCSWHTGGTGYHPQGPGQAWEVGLCEPHEMQQVHVQGPAPGSGNPKHKHRLGREWIKNSPEEKDLCACCPESQPYPRLHQKKCRSKKVIVSLYCALEYRPQPWNPQQIKDMDLMKWKKPKKKK